MHAGGKRTCRSPFQTSRRVPTVVCAASPSGASGASDAHEAPLARREALLAMLAAASVTAAAAQPAQAEECELQTAPDGLQFCDTKLGEGPEPVKGALIR